MVPAIAQDASPHHDHLPEESFTTVPVILARNIQKFFAGKLANKAHSSDMDVPALLEDIDMILEGRSLEDGRVLLRGMVADLLKEIDLLRFRLGETSQTLQRVKEERDVVNHDYRDRLLALTLALSSHSGEDPLDVQQRCQGGAILSADEATTLTIQTLTQKIENLELQLGHQQQDLALRRERIEDLESDNAAKTLKIAALERQFKSLNIHRNNNNAGAEPITEPSATRLITPTAATTANRRPKLVKLIDAEL